jgi:phage shock protein PspC (stress-responsive transcriptional regulator)
VVAGVCAGLAKRLGWDVSLVRVLYVLATIFTAFSGLLVYIVLWIVIPQE